MKKALIAYILIFFFGSFYFVNYKYNKSDLSLSQRTSFLWKPPYPWVDFSFQTNRKLVKNNAICLTVDPIDFFDFTKGIYVQGYNSLIKNKIQIRPNWFNMNGNFNMRGGLWKRNFSSTIYFENDKCFKSIGKIGIHGNNTRAYPQKSLALKFDKKELPELNKLNEFPVYSSVILRNGGNDWGISFCRDALVQQLLNNLHVESQNASPVPVFLNDSFFGLFFLMNKIDDNYLSKKYKVKKRKVTIIYNGQLDQGTGKGLRAFKTAVKELEQLHPDSNFMHINGFDPTDFLTYTAVNIITANQDWPNNNLKCFSINDQQFKFIYYDFDFTYDFLTKGKNVNIDMNNFILNRWGWFTHCYKNLIKNSSFRQGLNERINELLATTFSKSNQIAKLKKLKGEIQPFIALEIERWRYPVSENNWNEQMNILENCITQRFNYLMNFESPVKR